MFPAPASGQKQMHAMMPTKTRHGVREKPFIRFSWSSMIRRSYEASRRHTDRLLHEDEHDHLTRAGGTPTLDIEEGMKRALVVRLTGCATPEFLGYAKQLSCNSFAGQPNSLSGFANVLHEELYGDLKHVPRTLSRRLSGASSGVGLAGGNKSRRRPRLYPTSLPF